MTYERQTPLKRLGMANDHQGFFPLILQQHESLRGNRRLAGVRTVGERRHLGAVFKQEFIECLLGSRSFILSNFFKKIQTNIYLALTVVPSDIQAP